MIDITILFDAWIPGTKVHQREDGKILFEPYECGVAPGGRPWFNYHKLHRENAAPYMRKRALPWLVGDGVDIGCGLEKITPDCIGIDNGDDFQERAASDEIRDGSSLSGYEDNRFDWLYSCNALEHIENWQEALKDWVRVVRPGGILFLSMPWPAKCYLHAVGNTPAHRWNPTPLAVGRELETCGCGVVEADSDVDEWGCFVIVGRKHA
jgi:SAM-dependent methyltransferase